MASQIFIISLALMALLASSGAQDQIAEPEEFPTETKAEWATCEIGVDPKFSCHNCTTRMICTPVGGLLVPCRSPYRSHCNTTSGFCANLPSENCVENANV